MGKFATILMLLSITLFACCKKPKSGPLTNNSGSVVLKISHQDDGAQLIFDSLAFNNAAGNNYSITRLQYYLSSFKLYKGGRVCYSDQNVTYVDAREQSVTSLPLSSSAGFETGTYDSLTFLIGVDPALNYSNTLPATLENLSMGWPDDMGGGYHFFKLEGHWRDNTTISGFAMHIGQNGYQVHVCVPCNFSVPTTGDIAVNLTMNVNEWFKNPTTFSFIADGVFTMGDTVLMKKLSANGVDVFYSN
jgi:hypothetical protein